MNEIVLVIALRGNCPEVLMVVSAFPIKYDTAIYLQQELSKP